jgi:hypothetical protein
MVRAMREAAQLGSPLQARGGQLGGAGTPTGERVIVRFDGTSLDVFHETGSLRYHPELVEKIALEASEAPTGEVLVVASARHGCRIPVRFEGAERGALDQIIAAVR